MNEGLFFFFFFQRERVSKLVFNAHTKHKIGGCPTPHPTSNLSVQFQSLFSPPPSLCDHADNYNPGGGGTTDTMATNEGKVKISVCCWIGGLVYQEVSEGMHAPALCFIPQCKATEKDMTSQRSVHLAAALTRHEYTFNRTTSAAF